MESPPFLRIERDKSGGAQHEIVHLHEPKFALELAPDHDAPDRRGRGVIKRLRVPNSWAGDYTQYAKLMTAAQDFFAQSLEEPAPKAETRRLAR